VEILAGNVRARVIQATAEERAWLAESLTLRTPGGPHEERVTELYRLRDATFPSGLLRAVCAQGAKRGFQVYVDDPRVRPCAPDARAELAWLEEYQMRAVEECWWWGNGVVHMATAGGKTEVMAALARLLPCDWLILVHRITLLDEIASRIELRTGETVGRVGDDGWKTARVTVATFKTLAAARQARDPRAKLLLARARGLMIDEVHVVAADSHWRVAMATPNAHFRFGFSATPYARSDQRGMLVRAATGPTLVRVTMPELVALGVVAKGTIHMVELPVVPVFAKTYHDAYEAHVARNGRRRALAVALCGVAQKPALAFVRQEAHGKLVVDRLQAAGITSDFVWGKRNEAHRQRAVAQLEAGALDVLACSVIFQEGVNIPSLATVLHLSGGKAPIMTLQNSGRASRARDRAGAIVKTSFRTYDIADVHCGCRVVDAEGTATYRHRVCRWFDEHARARIRAYIAEGYDVVRHQADEFLAV
jgi:superfamily II DNA or RNA helicase